jgi:hypothetical protein
MPFDWEDGLYGDIGVGEVPRQLAIHEAGHAVLAFLACRYHFRNDDAFRDVWVRAKGAESSWMGDDTFGEITGCAVNYTPKYLFNRRGVSTAHTRADADRAAMQPYTMLSAMISLAGPIAESTMGEWFWELIHDNSQSDHENAVGCIMDYARETGFTMSDISNAILGLSVEDDAMSFFIEEYDRLRRFVARRLKRHWIAVEALADRLQVKHALDGEEAILIIKAHLAPRPTRGFREFIRGAGNGYVPKWPGC